MTFIGIGDDMSMKFPTCPEICRMCEEEHHVYHAESGLGSITVTRARFGIFQDREGLKIEGMAESDDALFDLLQVIKKDAVLMLASEMAQPTVEHSQPTNALLTLPEEDDECPNCHLGTIEKTGPDLFVCRGECGAFFCGPRKE
jgi:hypothetical protein